MKWDVRGWAVGGLLLLLAAAPAPSQSRYLVTWAMETKETAYADPMTREPQGMGRDFLAVFDIAPNSDDFGRLVAMLPVGSGAQMAHHTNYEMPADGILFASDYKSGNSFVFNLSDPLHPRLTSTFSNAGTYTHAHSFVRLANGNTLATYQYNGPREREAVGALVELDPNGKVVRATDASDPSVEAFIRPYSLEVVAKLDRVVTGSDEMPPATGNSHVVQVWRLSDLKLLKTIVLPKAPHSDAVPQNAAEPRLLADGQTVVVATSGCGLYRINDLGGTNPSAQWIYDFGARTCGVPTVVGNYWVESNYERTLRDEPRYARFRESAGSRADRVQRPRVPALDFARTGRQSHRHHGFRLDLDPHLSCDDRSKHGSARVRRAKHRLRPQMARRLERYGHAARNGIQ